MTRDHLKAKPHSLSKDTLAKLKFKSAEFKSLGTIDAKWKRVFHILFPTVPKDRIPCPLSKNAKSPRELHWNKLITSAVKHDRELPPLNAQEDLQKLCAALKRQVFDRFSVDLAVHVPDLWNEFEPLFDAAVEGAQGKENPPTPESSDAVPVQNESAMLRSLEWVQDLPSSPPGLQILHGFSTTLDQPQQSSFRPGHTAYGAHVANGISEIGPLSQSHFPVDYGSSYCATYYGDCIPLHSLPNPSEDAPVSQESRRPSSMDYEPTDQSSEHSSQDATSPCQTTLIKAEPEDTSPPVGYEFWRNRELMNDCRWHRHITRDAKPVIRQDSSNAAGRRASGQHGKGIVCRVDHAENRLCMPKIEDDSSSCSSPSFAANENENHNHAGQTETYDSSIASAGSSASPSLSSSWDEECIDYNDSSSLQISDEKQAVEVFSSEAVADAMPRNVQSFPFRRDTL